jgi:hypothetical protein
LSVLLRVKKGDVSVCFWTHWYDNSSIFLNRPKSAAQSLLDSFFYDLRSEKIRNLNMKRVEYLAAVFTWYWKIVV